MSTKSRVTAKQAEVLRELLVMVTEATESVEDLLDELADEMEAADRDTTTEELDEAIRSLRASVTALSVMRGGS